MYPIRIGRDWYVGPVGGFFDDAPKSDLDYLIGINSDCLRKSEIEEYSLCLVEPIDGPTRVSAVLQIFPLESLTVMSIYSPEGEAVLPLPSLLSEGNALSLRFGLNFIYRASA